MGATRYTTRTLHASAMPGPSQPYLSLAGSGLSGLGEWGAACLREAEGVDGEVWPAARLSELEACHAQVVSQ